MITPWDIYWITRLDSLGILLAIISVVLGCVLFTTGILGGIEDYFTASVNFRKWFVRGTVMFSVSLSLLVFVPTTTEVAAIYMIPKIANNEQVQKLPDNAMKFINGKFEEWISDMTKKKKEK